MNARYSILLLIFLFICPVTWTDSLFFEKSEMLVAALAEHGFENIHVSVRQNNTIAIQYENRLYRNELFASGIVAALVNDLLDEEARIALVPCRRALPICELEIDLRDYRHLLAAHAEDGNYDVVRVKSPAASTPLRPTGVTKPSFGKLDITLYPAFSVHLGNYDDRFKMFFALMPVLSTTLWRGAAVYVEASIPIYNDVNYHYYRFKDYAQISKAAFSQIVRLPYDFVTSVNVGAFNPNRWGVSGEVLRHFMHRHLAVGYSIEYTGFLLYYDQEWNYSDMRTTTSKLYATYYADLLDCQFGVSYNKYIMQDAGPMFEFSRNFQETMVGCFFGATELDKFGGIMLRFPFSPQRRPRPRIVRLATPSYYDYSYRATNVIYTQHAPIQTGISVYTGTKLTYLYLNLTPSYVRNNLRVYREAYNYLTLESDRQDEDEYLFKEKD
ncbi:YjbH domain-containing protein [candidate division KSB1 bacterium]|nr:YjbH domain-containing protein [candidate division KSB1 bacterium]